MALTKDMAATSIPLDDACPCGSGRALADCCGPLLAGAPAATAEALMRSRYTAHVRGAIDYIVDTHDPATRAALDRRAIARWAKESDWLGLTILAADEAAGVVEFAASYRPLADGREQRHHERSRFLRHDGRWFYRDGIHVPSAPAARAATVGRNDPCPCGSGKKSKKCCG
jgi:SEC-C motif-containing protein